MLYSPWEYSYKEHVYMQAWFPDEFQAQSSTFSKYRNGYQAYRNAGELGFLLRFRWGCHPVLTWLTWLL